MSNSRIVVDKKTRKRDFFRFFRRIWYKITDIPYLLKQRFIRQHYLIKTTLPRYCWIDTDERMMYGMFDLFLQFIRDENPYRDFEHPECTEREKQIGKTMHEIEKWWKNYPNRQDTIMRLQHDWWNEVKSLNSPLGFPLRSTPMGDTISATLRAEEDKLAREEQEMLHKLMDIRGSLWT